MPFQNAAISASARFGPSAALFGALHVGEKIQTEAVGTEYLDLSFTSWCRLVLLSVDDYEWFTSLVKQQGVATLEHTI
jgi:hypothetical protein